MSKMLSVGTKTPYGEVISIGYIGKPPNHERYYWLLEDDGEVSAMRGTILEATHND